MKPSDFLTELSTEKLAQYKTAASADATKADKEKDFARGNKRFSGIVKATNKQFANDAKKESVGLNYPETYEQTNDKFKSRGQRRVAALTNEEDMSEGTHHFHPNDILDEAAPWVDKLGLGNFFRKVQGVDADNQSNIRILSGVNHSMQLYFKTIMAMNASVGPTAALFWPLLGKQALMFVGGALVYTVGKILAGKAGRALFGSADEALAFAKAHLAAAQENNKTSFEFDGKTYPVTVKDPSAISKLEQQLGDLEKIVFDKKTRAAQAEYNKSIKAPKPNSQNIPAQPAIAEEWSKKYKDSINCSNPKGFSQKAHCAGKKKHNEDVAEEKKPDFMKAGNMKPVKASGEEIPGAVHALEKLLLKAKEQGVKLNYNNIDKIMQSVCKKHNLTGDELHNEFVSKHHMIPDNWIVKQLDEACWKGYHKEGNKKMFGKTYPNCVKNEGVAEGKGLAKKVKVVKGEHAGKTGWIREIKHGAFKGAPKTYYIDLDDGGQANNLPATALRLVKEQGVAEGYRRVAGLLTDIANPQNPMVKDPDTYNELPAAEYFKSHPEFDQQTWQQEVQKNIQAMAQNKQRQQQGLVVNPLTGEQQLQSEVDAQRKELERILSPEEQEQFISLKGLAKGRFLKQVWAKKADQKQFANLMKVHWTGGAQYRDKLEQILSGRVSSKAELSARMYKNQEEIPGNKPGWGTDTIGLVLDGWTTIAGFQDLRSDNQKIGKGSADRSQQKYTVQPQGVATDVNKVKATQADIEQQGGWNEALVDNWKVKAAVVTNGADPESIALVQKYKIPIIDRRTSTGTIEKQPQGVAEGSDELYQKAIRKYVQQVAHDYLGGGNAHLYGANKFDSEMFGVSQEQAKQDFKTLFPQALKQLQGVAEGLSQNQGQVRQTLNAWMNQDQSMNADPTQRASFQAKVWPYIQKNINSILSDKGADGKGSYPAAPYAAWLLVQHMDAYPQNQGKFASQLEQAGLDPTDGKDGVGKLQFLKDRYEVNKWILQNANNKEYFINNKPLPNPTVNVRNPAMFKDAGQVATSRDEALKNAIAAGNKLLVAAVQAPPVKLTQPSYKSNVAEGQHSCPHCGGEMVSEELMNEKKDACYYKVKSRYKVWPSAYASGALVKCRKSHGSWGNGGKKNESSILEGIERADENLHKWFKEKWVRFGPDGKIRGDCARGDDSEGKPKCLPQSKAQNLGKKGRASAAARKRREDPNPERSGPAINVNTKKK